MSGIYGVCRFDGGPVTVDWLKRMRSAMACYGRDGGGSAADGSLGMGHLLFAISPEDQFERQPAETDRGLIVSAARLDNREELLRAFDISVAEAAKTPDGRLVGLAFDRWGESLCSHLQGDWALAAWDRRERRLLLARDAFGNATLYFHQGKGFLAFASSMKALLALPGVAKEPDPLRLAQVLVSWQHDAELTAYKGFRRLVWAHRLMVGPDGQTNLRRYWSPDRRELLAWRRDADYEEAFLDHYTRAVRDCVRTDTPVAVMLSGGRDSGSVTVLAAPLLAAQGRELAAYTSVPAFPPDGAGAGRLGDEWDQAHATAVMAGPNVRHTPVDAAGYSVIQGIEHHLDIHDGPSHAAGNHYWIQAITETAVRNGAGMLLTGQLGNTTVSWTGNGSSLLALCQGYPRLALELLLHVDSDVQSAFRRQIINPILTPLRRWKRHLQSHEGQPWRAYSALNQSMAKALDLDSRMRAAGYDPTFTISPLQDQRLLLVRPFWTIGAGLWSEIGAMHGLAVRDPTSNLALLEFLLRVPDTQFRRSGQSSSLFRRALRGRLPDCVLDVRNKGLQSADLGHRVLKEMPAMRRLIDAFDSNPVVREFLDTRLLRKCLDDLGVRVDPDTTANAVSIVMRGLGVGMFLLRFA